MRTSEAIIRGCEVCPRKATSYYIREGDSYVSACVLGAAAIGMLGLEGVSLNELRRKASEIRVSLEQQALCPEGCSFGTVSVTVGTIMVHLNDSHDWSRERIAEWLKERGL